MTLRICMLTGRMDQGEARMAVSEWGVCRKELTSRREPVDVERAPMDRGLRIQEALPEIPDPFDVRFPMDAPKVRDRRGRRRFDPMEEPFPLQALDDGPKTVRPLHVERRRDMVEEPRIVHDHDDGKRAVDFKASSGPNGPQNRDGSMNDTDGQRSLRIGS